MVALGAVVGSSAGVSTAVTEARGMRQVALPAHVTAMSSASLSPRQAMPRTPPASSGSVPMAVVRGSMSSCLPSWSFTAAMASSSRRRIMGLVAARATTTAMATTMATITNGFMART
jgi:hypothetical protein